MPRQLKWLRTDTHVDAVESLEKVAELLVHVPERTNEWKWVLIAAHSALQGFLVLALEQGNGLQTLKPSHTKKWLKAYETGDPWPDKLDLDYFLQLYEKVKGDTISHHLGATRFVSESRHDDSMTMLNELRNGFIHFTPKSWSIKLATLPTICLDCFDVVDFLAWDSGAILWHSSSLSKRAKKAMNRCRRRLHELSSVYGTDELTLRLTRTPSKRLNIPRKSRHLDVTREEVSDAESRAEEN